MRVAIRSCTKDEYWYKGSIGKVFEVEQEFTIKNEEWYKIVNKSKGIFGVLKKDVIDVNDLVNGNMELDANVVNNIIVQARFNDEKNLMGELELEIVVYEMSEEMFLKYIKTLNSKASLKHNMGILHIRNYNKKIISNLKKRYNYTCQICSYSSKEYNARIVEAHHIEEFSLTQNNSYKNLIIVCPNHHRLIHLGNGIIDLETRTISYDNGHLERIDKIGHLGGENNERNI